MAAALRRRHAPEQVEDPEYERFLEKYNSVVSPHQPYGNASSRWMGRIISIAGAVAMIFIIIANTGGSSSSGNQQNLVLVTFYPLTVSRRVNEYAGQTELLVTDENRDVVDAIRTTIAMENNLKNYGRFHAKNRRRRKQGITGMLLSFSNWISSFNDSGEENGKDFLPGEVVLKSMDYRGMREYLSAHGSRCFESKVQNDAVKNIVLRVFDKLVNRYENGVDTDEHSGTSWNRALQICAWCVILNGDARGFIEHGTKIKMKYSSYDLNSILEDARISGAGIALKQSTTGDLSARYLLSPLFVLPADIHGDSTPDSTTTATDVLAWLIELPSNIPFLNEAPTSLSKLISRMESTIDESSKRHIFFNGNATFLSLKSEFSSAESPWSLRWLAKSCPDSQVDCVYIVDPHSHQ